MNRYIVFSVLVVAMLLLLLYPLFQSKKHQFEVHDLSAWVNPMVGTDAHGHTFPGAVYPFGMVQLSPDTRLDGWDGCSGYHYTDSVIYGFSHTHLSGTGCSDYGDILLMPMSNKYSLLNQTDVLYEDAPGFLFPYSSSFSHNTETASPGFYSVHLNEPDVHVSLTVTERTGMHKYTFNKSGQRYVILDLKHRDLVLDAWVQQVSATRLVGMRKSKAWAEEQYVFFAIDFNTEVTVVADWSKPEQSDYSLKKYSGDNLVMALKVQKRDVDEVLVKVALSPVSVEGAIKNMETENAGWDFETIKNKATEAWNVELSRILVSGGSEEQRKVFYTALYHSFIHPSLAHDVDGRYRTTDLNVYRDSSFTNYTVFSLWDTYRAVHPLFTIVQQQRSLDFIQTFLVQYRYGGQLPMWELSANETGCMIGYHAVPPMVDAYLKGINNFDANLALEAMMHRAEADELGKRDYMKYGFLPVESEHESVSKTLEYAYNDWCIAQFALSLGNTDVYREYTIRSQAWKHIFDPGSGFMRPRVNGAWKEPFDPKEVDHNFTEANSWQYSFYVPHDILGLIEFMGGEKAFEQKLDELFSTGSETHGKDLKDITGLIGQYAHGNEPSHHIAYLYNYCRKPEKTQQMVRNIMAEMYHSGPAGNCGNEDCGQMSAWYVLSALGFYPVNPANGVYDIGSPLFDKAIIQLENGRRFEIIAHNNSEKNMYIQRILLNGSEYKKSYLLHSDIAKGGRIEFFMGPLPGKTVGVSEKDVYASAITENLITPAPVTGTPARTFRDSLLINLQGLVEGSEIFYSLDKGAGYKPYSVPIVISNDCEIWIYAQKQSWLPSKPIKAAYVKIDESRSINLKSQYSSLYTAGGDDALINRLRGNNDFRSGDWQGFRAQDVEVVVDLGQILPVASVETGFIQDMRSWIMMPLFVEYYFSVDGVHFVKMQHLTHNIADNEPDAVVHQFRYEPGNYKTRYVKMFARYYGKLPAWHLGAGYESWLFADEIDIQIKK